jgi:hypothetical protein
MKRVIFEKKECNLLFPLLEKRIEEYKTCGLLKSQAVAEVLINEIKTGEIYFSDSKLSFISGCLKEYLPQLNSKITYLKKMTAFDWLNISQAELDIIQHVDSYHIILNKINSRNKKQVFTKNLELIERIKNCHLIGISHTDNGVNIYKIGFIDKTDYISLKTSEPLDFKVLEFVKIKSMKVLNEEYSEILSKQTAKDTVKNAIPVLKDEDTLKFIKAII